MGPEGGNNLHIMYKLCAILLFSSLAQAMPAPKNNVHVQRPTCTLSYDIVHEEKCHKEEVCHEEYEHVHTTKCHTKLHCHPIAVEIPREICISISFSKPSPNPAINEGPEG